MMRGALSTLAAAVLVAFPACSSREVARPAAATDILPAEELDTDRIEQLEWRAEHPYDLNTVSARELACLPGISASDAESLVALRRKTGRLRSLDQLTGAGGISDILVERLRPYVDITDDEPGGGAPQIEFRFRHGRSLQSRRGYAEGWYLGNPDKDYARLRAASSFLEAGLLLEKDDGETYDAGFASGYVLAGDPRSGNCALAGDFRFEAGQGLALWSGGGAGGTDPSSVPVRRARGIIPHRSSDEIRFFRGVALQGVIGRTFKVSAFASKRRLPGSFDSFAAIVHVDQDGSFRTASEHARTNAFDEIAFGGNAEVHGDGGLTAGVSALATRLVHRQTGSVVREATAGFYGSLRLSHVELFGEMTWPSLSWILGAVFEPARSIAVSVLVRDYAPASGGRQTSAFGIRADSQNERGLYLAVRLKPASGIMMALSLDTFLFPAGSGTADVRADGYEAVSSSDVRLSRATQLSIRLSTVRREENSTGLDDVGREVRVLAQSRRSVVRATITHAIGKAIRLRSRFERVDIQAGQRSASENGMLVFQDLRIQMPMNVSAEARVSFFQTDSFAAGVYEFENDVPGSFSVPVLFGVGTRWYALLRVGVFTGGLLSVRYSETRKDGTATLGSGYGAIEGDLDNDVTIQLDWRF